MNALKCLYQALKADKDLIRLFQKISEIRINSKIEGIENSKELDELVVSDSNRNDFASTYLNIWAILSLMGNHEKALHMSQKAIEMITQEIQNRYFVFDEFLDSLANPEKGSLNSQKKTLLITLAAAYYNKTIELEFMNNSQAMNKEYLIMANESIGYAMEWCKRIPKELNLSLVEEITRMNDKLKFKQASYYGMSSRASSRRSNNRMYSPQIYQQIKDTNIEDLQKYIDTSPKSLDGGPKMANFGHSVWMPDKNSFSPIKNQTMKYDKNINPIYKRTTNKIENKGNQTELQINYSPFDSDGAGEYDNESIKYSENSGTATKKHYYFTKRNSNKMARRVYMTKPEHTVVDIKKKITTNNLPILENNGTSKTSFDCQPIIPKSTSFKYNKNKMKIDRNSVEERCYGMDEPEIVQEWRPKQKKIDRISCLKI